MISIGKFILSRSIASSLQLPVAIVIYESNLIAIPITTEKNYLILTNTNNKFMFT